MLHKLFTNVLKAIAPFLLPRVPAAGEPRPGHFAAPLPVCLLETRDLITALFPLPGQTNRLRHRTDRGRRGGRGPSQGPDAGRRARCSHPGFTPPRPQLGAPSPLAAEHWPLTWSKAAGLTPRASRARMLPLQPTGQLGRSAPLKHHVVSGAQAAGLHGHGPAWPASAAHSATVCQIQSKSVLLHFHSKWKPEPLTKPTDYPDQSLQWFSTESMKIISVLLSTPGSNFSCEFLLEDFSTQHSWPGFPWAINRRRLSQLRKPFPNSTWATGTTFLANNMLV